jgi:hypothetical protein
MAYTEFYTQSGGSNLNAGSTTNNTALYTSVSGNWVQATRVFTPTDGINPVSAGVAVGMYMSVFLNAAAVTTYIGKVSAVTNAINGTITIDGTVNTQVPPANGTGTISVKVGGAWAGPNAAVGFPFDFSNIGSLATAPSSVRVNLSDAASYSITAVITGVTQLGVTYQGYHTTPGDDFKATIDQGTTAAVILNLGQGAKVINLKFISSATTGTNSGVSLNGNNVMFRCVVKGSRGTGINCSGQAYVSECEVYEFNKSNTASTPGINVGGLAIITNNYIHDGTSGTGCCGITTGAGTDAKLIYGNVIETLSGDGILVQSNSSSSILTHQILNNTIYNCRNGIFVSATAGRYFLIVQNNQIIKNSAFGFQGNSTFTQLEGVFYNNGYGSGTQANGSGDYNGTGNMILDDGTGNSSRTVFASNVSPFVDADNGDFRINLAAANFAGRQFFTQTDTNLTQPNTIGYPDIGAVQSLTGPGGTFSKEVSYGFS